jgi:alkanesulfonate monooxygenase SsuD/methylene tetrahydromethanopterin reductase-like flavin-dependent oxidoreductase (luciferase family)
MIGGGGEKKTLRLVARHADACNLFVGRDEARKLEILRQHCEAVGRDCDTIYKTAYYFFDTRKGAAQIVDELGALAGLGFDAAIAWSPTCGTLHRWSSSAATPSCGCRKPCHSRLPGVF